MALRALNSVVAANYGKLSTDPVLAGDLVAFDTSTSSQNVNPSCVQRADRLVNTVRAAVIGVCADDAVGTNPSGETPTMINNDPAGSNFVNGSIFQSYTAGFYVGVKRYIGDFKDESIDVVTNLTAGVPTYSQRGVSVYTTPSSQFVTDRFALLIAGATLDNGGTWSPVPGDIIGCGCSNTYSTSAFPSQPTATNATSSTNNAGLLVKQNGNGPVMGRVDYYDSGAGLLYWTLF